MKNFEVENISGLTTHAYTATQSLLDVVREKGKPRKDRAAAVNIIPSDTGAAKAVEIVLPELKGKLNLSAVRVPVVTGSLVYMVFNLKNPTTPEAVNAVFKNAAENEMKGIIEYSTDDLVSCDIIGNEHSCIVDAQLTEINGNSVKMIVWYDNEWGYANRLVELARKAL